MCDVDGVIRSDSRLRGLVLLFFGKSLKPVLKARLAVLARRVECVYADHRSFDLLIAEITDGSHVLSSIAMVSSAGGYSFPALL